jgi:hypothetical protein
VTVPDLFKLIRRPFAEAVRTVCGVEPDAPDTEVIAAVACWRALADHAEVCHVLRGAPNPDGVPAKTVGEVAEAWEQLNDSQRAWLRESSSAAMGLLALALDDLVHEARKERTPC